MITSLLFFPEREFIEQPSRYGLNGENAFPVTADGIRLHGWYFQAEKPKGALLFLHGNAGNIADRLHKVTGWVQRGICVLLLDYRGYGQSEGAIQKGEDLVTDARAGLSWLLNEKQWPLQKIIFYGESLGSHPAVRLAVDFKAAGLVLEAPFTAFTDLASIHYPALPKMAAAALLKEFQFDNLSRISNIQNPFFVMHGSADATCPYAMSQKLYERAPQPKFFLSVPNAGHNNLLEAAGESFWESPFQFILKNAALADE